VCEYQQFSEQQEKQEYFNDCVKVAVEKEVASIISKATCFDCDNPLTVLKTEDGGISVKPCQKCHGLPTFDTKEDADRLDAIHRGIDCLSGMMKLQGAGR
jgi:hypothetical protein